MFYRHFKDLGISILCLYNISIPGQHIYAINNATYVFRDVYLYVCPPAPPCYNMAVATLQIKIQIQIQILLDRRISKRAPFSTYGQSNKRAF